MDKMYSTQAAAEFLKISVRTLRRWVKSGKLSRSVAGDIHFGGGDMFSVTDLKKALLIDNDPDEKSNLPSGNAGDIINYERNYMTDKEQIQRKMLKVTVPCDKLSGMPFTYTAEEYAKIISENIKLGCIEQSETKTSPKVVTPFWLENLEGYTDLKPLGALHREILFAFISAHEQGYRYVTFIMLLNSMTGNEANRVYREQFEAFASAIEKLQKTAIKIDLTRLFEAMPNYRKNYKGSACLSGYLLPCTVVVEKINGQMTLAIKLIDESPLMTVAKIKNQLISYETAPLKIANQNNTPRGLVIKNWLLRRIELIKQRRKRKLSPTILFDTFYEECGLAEASRSAKRYARKFFFDALDNFKAAGTIEDYSIEYEGNKLRAITISAKKTASTEQN